MMKLDNFRSLCADAFAAANRFIEARMVSEAISEDDVSVDRHSLHSDAYNEMYEKEMGRQAAFTDMEFCRMRSAANNKFTIIAEVVKKELQDILQGQKVHVQGVEMTGIVDSIDVFPVDVEQVTTCGGVLVALKVRTDDGAVRSCNRLVTYQMCHCYHGYFADFLYDLCDGRNWVPNACRALKFVHPLSRSFTLIFE